MIFSRRPVTAIVLTIVLSTLSFAASPKKSKKDAAQTLQGYLVDNSCALEKHKSADWAAKHGKGCLNMEECAKSGYAILTPDQKLYKFDNKGNTEARKLIDTTDKKNDWKITLKGKIDSEHNTVAVSALDLQR
jgi:hypothetical protein